MSFVQGPVEVSHRKGVHSLMLDLGHVVTILPWGPSTAYARHQEGYDEEELIRMQATSGKEEQEDYKPEQESWQISFLVSTDTFGASRNTGDVQTERMKIM